MSTLLLQACRAALALLAVLWGVSVLGWMPEAIASGRWLGIVAGIAVALLPAWGYTRITAVLESRKAADDPPRNY